MNNTTRIKNKRPARYALQGFFEGLLIPALGFIIEIIRLDLPLSLSSIVKIHINNPLLWLIDSMPLFISFLSYAYNREIELTAQTKYLEKEIEKRSNKILEQKTFYESLINNSPVAIVTMDADQRIISINQAFSNIFQYTQDEVQKKDLDEIIAGGNELNQAQNFTNEVLSGGKIHGIGKRRRKDGALVDVEIYGVPILCEEKRIGVLGMYIDITDRKQAEESIKKSELRFRGLFHDSPISMWEVNFSKLKGFLNNLEFTNPDEIKVFLEKTQSLEKEFPALIDILDVNQAALSLFKADDLNHLKENFENIFIDQSVEAIQYIILSLYQGSHQIETEFVYRTLDGVLIHTIVRLSLVTGYEGDWSRVYVSILDITERKWSEERLRYLSLHDSMTGLYNRSFFEAELRRLSHGREFPVSIIVCDLDNLKRINDTYGHKSGDTVICKTASLLVECFRNEDVVARLGGDEFAVIIPYLTEPFVLRIVERLREKFNDYNQTLSHNDHGNQINLSIGSATTQTNIEMEELFKIADKRMYSEKSKKRASAKSNAQ